MTSCATWGSLPSAGSSALEFSSASFFWALSQSKMPPQQSNGLLHLIDEIDDFSAHDVVLTKIHRLRGSIKAAGTRRQPTFDHRLALGRRRAGPVHRRRARGSHLVADHLGLGRRLFAGLEGFEDHAII